MPPLQAVFFCDWHTENPYLSQLIEGLQHQDVSVSIQDRKQLWIHRILLAKPSVDIVHFQTLHRFFVSRNPIYCWFKFLLFVGQVWLLRSVGIAAVLTIHEWKDKLSGGNFNISPIKAYILGRTFSAAIAHCDSAKAEYLEATQLSQNARVFTVPHGSYLGVYPNDISHTQAREQLNIASDAFVFLLFGGIHPSKGTLDAIDAFIELEKERIAEIQQDVSQFAEEGSLTEDSFLQDSVDAQLVIAGKASADIAKTIRTKIEGRLAGKIKFNPDYRIPDDEIQLYMNACNSVVLPYRIFTTSGVALLAMSFAKPCIAPDSGFFKDVLTGGGILYDPDDSTGLRQAMALAVSQPTAIKAMGNRNLAQAKCWNWDYVAKETRQLYDCVAKSSLITRQEAS